MLPEEEEEEEIDELEMESIEPDGDGPMGLPPAAAAEQGVGAGRRGLDTAAGGAEVGMTIPSPAAGPPAEEPRSSKAPAKPAKSPRDIRLPRSRRGSEGKAPEGEGPSTAEGGCLIA